jgi:hypothetical protein
VLIAEYILIYSLAEQSGERMGIFLYLALSKGGGYA